MIHPPRRPEYRQPSFLIAQLAEDRRADRDFSGPDRQQTEQPQNERTRPQGGLVKEKAERLGRRAASPIRSVNLGARGRASPSFRRRSKFPASCELSERASLSLVYSGP